MPDSTRHNARTDVAYSRSGLLLTLGVIAAALSIYTSEPINLTGLKLLCALPVIWLTNSLETIRFYPTAKVVTLPLAVQALGRLALYTTFLGILFHSAARTEESFMQFCAITFPVLCACKMMALVLEAKLARARQETLPLTTATNTELDRDLPR